MKFKHLLLVVIVVSMCCLVLGGCKKVADGDNDNNDLSNRQNLEKGIATLGSQFFGFVDAMYGMAAAIPADATYNNGTGFWSFSVTTLTGESIDVQMKFLDASGKVQKVYNPVTTKKMLLKGDMTGVFGTMTFDLEITGVEAAASTLTVNGSGTITYMGITGKYTVANVKIPKNAAYPASGTISMTMYGVTITLTYNGTNMVTATYTWMGHSYSIKINLDTGTLV